MPTVIRKARHDDARHRTRCTGSGAEAAAEAAASPEGKGWDDYRTGGDWDVSIPL